MLKQIINFFQNTKEIISAPEVLGMDISDFSIEVVSLTGSINRNIQLVAVGNKVLEPGIIRNGKVLKKEVLKKILKDLIQNPVFGKINSKRFVFSVPTINCFIYVFEVSKNLNKKEQSDFIIANAGQVFPFSLKELYFDFLPRERNGKKEALLAASPKNIIDDYLEIFKDLKVKPLVITIEPESLFKSLVESVKKDEAVLVVDIGAKVTNFSIFDKIGLKASFSNDVAGNRFTKRLSEKLNISQEKAENFKKRIGLNPDVKEGKIFLILQKEIQTIILEIKKVKNYFQKKEGRKIEKIILTGGSSKLPGLKKYLEENLKEEILIGNPWSKMNFKDSSGKKYFEQVLKKESLCYSTAIGSALIGLEKSEKNRINFAKKIKD